MDKRVEEGRPKVMLPNCTLDSFRQAVSKQRLRAAMKEHGTGLADTEAEV
jgi:hypothetical protein